MKQMILSLSIAIMATGFFQSAKAQKTIVDIAAGSSDHTTLVAAVKAAELVEALKTGGPFTVFAPVNAAFEKLPAGTLSTLLKPENKKMLTGILTYHVVQGNWDAASVIKAITAGNGSATVTTLQGGSLVLSLSENKVVLTDANGGRSTVILADLKADNGVIHVVDTVVLPK